MRDGVEEDRGIAHFDRIVAKARILSKLAIQVAIADAQGNTIASTMDLPKGAPVNISDREHFHYQMTNNGDDVFVSPPVFGRVSGSWSVQLTRRLRKPDGSFDGAVVMSLAPEVLARASSPTALTKRYRVDLVGLDGIVRASDGDGKLPLAKVISDDDVMSRLRNEDGDAFPAADDPRAPPRIYAVKHLESFPLAIIASIPRAMHNGALRVLMARFGPTVLLTLIIVAAMLYSGHRYIEVEKARAAALMKSEFAAARKAHELSVTLANMDQGIIMVDRDRRIAVINARAAELLSLPAQLREPGASFDAAVDDLKAKGAFGTSQDGEAREARFRAATPDQIVTCYDGTVGSDTILEIRTERLDDGGFVRTVSDVTQRRQAEAKVRHLAQHDALTGLANRVTFRDELVTGTAAATREQPLAAYVLDLDRFKLVNDTLGHPVGDRLLKLVAERLRRCVRNGDLVSRLSGDEFAILQSSGATPESCEQLATRILQTVAAPYHIDGREICVGVSVGIATAPEHGSDPDELMTAADLALYKAKREGRGKFCVFTPQISAEVVQRRTIEQDLRGAAERGEFMLHYQPVIDVADGHPASFEALVRWQHPTRGLVSPAEFIHIAEEIGVITDIGRWVLETACREAATWPEPLSVAVNLSPVQFKDRNLDEIIIAALEAAQLSPSRLILEITETTLMQQDDETVALLQRLRRAGIVIALDDFGQGYASLGYLLKFPFDKIKIDRHFIQRLGQTGAEDSTAVVRAMLDVATALGIAAIAEGVETQAQLDCLKSLGCGKAQGFLFSRPVPPNDLADAHWLDAKSKAA